MRLAFPNGEHEEVTIGKGTTSIGSAPDDDVSLSASGIRAGHALIIVDQRGITLAGGTDGSDTEPMRVNEREVVEKAILRLGDQLRIGPVSMVLRGDQPDESVPSPAGASAAEDAEQPARFLLRGVAGHYQGRVHALLSSLTLGSSDTSDMVIAGVSPSHATIELHGDDVYLRVADGSQVDVNGNLVGSVRLSPGDQIAMGDERIILETPGFVPGKAYGGEAKGAESSNTQVFTAPVIDQSSAEPARRDERDSRRRRDNLVVGICLAISLAMLLWLAWIYISS
ncbi:MAG: FHA domain-containing protein [Xanthomonadales bacterium]|nr:FHA domain-containing protein [Xanthomonadales bacterium]